MENISFEEFLMIVRKGWDCDYQMYVEGIGDVHLVITSKRHYMPKQDNAFIKTFEIEIEHQCSNAQSYIDQVTDMFANAGFVDYFTMEITRTEPPKTKTEIRNTTPYEARPDKTYIYIKPIKQIIKEETVKTKIKIQHLEYISISKSRNSINPKTLHRNLGGLSYPGGDNPMTYGGDYTYSFFPESRAEFPAIGHDRRYDNLGTTGASGLFMDTRAIGADWYFVSENLNLAFSSDTTVTGRERTTAYILGMGLGLFASPKTIFHFGTKGPIIGMFEVLYWFNKSNKGVNNVPDLQVDRDPNVDIGFFFKNKNLNDTINAQK